MLKESAIYAKVYFKLISNSLSMTANFNFSAGFHWLKLHTSSDNIKLLKKKKKIQTQTLRSKYLKKK